MKTMNLFILFFLLIVSLNAQPGHIIFVDIHNCKDKAPIIDQLYRLIDSINNTNDRFVLFVSNDKRPSISVNPKQAYEAIDNLTLIRPSIPNVHDDLDTLNKVICSVLNLYSGIYVHYFPFAGNVTGSDHIEALLEKLLLINGFDLTDNELYLHVIIYLNKQQFIEDGSLRYLEDKIINNPSYKYTYKYYNQ
jgi:hypothetical protein